MSEKRVFVTGSTGCIGAHAVSILLSEGCEVFGFNRKPPADLPFGYVHLDGDLSEKRSIESALQKSQPTHILHLGALQTPDCRDYPIRGLDVNVLGTAYLFKACLEMDLSLERFVFASSSAVNGPRDLYGESGVSRRSSSTFQSVWVLEDSRGGHGTGLPSGKWSANCFSPACDHLWSGTRPWVHCCHDQCT